jgi:ABC-type antimicrobial peptide transport system permease subunit
MALGARRGNLLALVLGEGLWLTAAGIGLGLLISAAVTRGLSGLLYGVRPVDPLTFAGVALFLVGVGLMASYWPARRATRVDPLKALRYE